MSASSWSEVDALSSGRADGWSVPALLAFRFTFAFLALQLTWFVTPFTRPAIAVWDPVVKAAAPILFGVRADVLPNGSGDTTWNWVQLFLTVVGALFAGGIWTAADRRASSYPRLHRWLRVYVRFALAAAMIGYGAAKVFPSQFPPPSLERLVTSFGEASPMGLMWAFMGASTAYNVFTGAGEVLAGLLLTARRTTLAGALLSAVILTNIVALNFMYDVPVKIFSSLLLFMALVLIAPDLPPLFRFLFQPPASAPWWSVTVRTVLVIAFVATAFTEAAKSHAARGSAAPRSPFYGIWTVHELTVDGQARPPLLTDQSRWRRFIFDGPQTTTIQLVSDARQRYTTELDGDVLVLGRRDDPSYRAVFRYTRPSPRGLTLDGTMDGRTYHVTLVRDDDRTFLLTTRGFHWVSEYPFHR
jgi:hypothetical protein